MFCTLLLDAVCCVFLHWLKISFTKQCKIVTNIYTSKVYHIKLNYDNISIPLLYWFSTVGFYSLNGAKDKVKMHKGHPPLNWAPEGPLPTLLLSM